MRAPKLLAAAALCVAALSCGSSEPTSTVEQEDQGLIYRLSAAEFVPYADGTPSLLIVMQMENPGTEPITKTYPAGCPIRMRFYRQLDNKLIYDETKLPCLVDSPATLTVQPGETRTLGSGQRQMIFIMGDSIPCQRYRLTGVIQTEQPDGVEVEAGEAFLRAYPSWPTPRPTADPQCN